MRYECGACHAKIEVDDPDTNDLSVNGLRNALFGRLIREHEATHSDGPARVLLDVQDSDHGG